MMRRATKTSWCGTGGEDSAPSLGSTGVASPGPAAGTGGLPASPAPPLPTDHEVSWRGNPGIVPASNKMVLTPLPWIAGRSLVSRRTAGMIGRAGKLSPVDSTICQRRQALANLRRQHSTLDHDQP